MLVMVAEDDGLHRAFVRNIIEHLWPGNVEVIETARGDVAMDLARNREPPYVVLDLQLPKATGIVQYYGHVHPVVNSSVSLRLLQRWC